MCMNQKHYENEKYKWTYGSTSSFIFFCFKMNINNAHCTFFINAKAGEVLKTF